MKLYDRIIGTGEFKSGEFFTAARMATVCEAESSSVRAELSRMVGNEMVEAVPSNHPTKPTKYRKRSNSRHWITRQWR